MSGTRPLLASFFAHARQRRPGSAGPGTAAGLIETTIPARLDRLGWGRFHTLVVLALGITWILDGLEVTLAGAVAGALRESPTLVLSNAEVGLASSFYLAGAVLGALLFGWLTDRLGPQAALLHYSRRLSCLDRLPRRLPGISQASPCSAFSPVQGSAANIQPLPPAFRSLCPRATAAIPISSSMVASG